MVGMPNIEEDDMEDEKNDLSTLKMDKRLTASVKVDPRNLDVEKVDTFKKQ